jgi:hypothetical protein
VLLRDGRRGTVIAYEGCWKSCTFPVLIDRTGQSLMLSTSDVTVLVIGGRTADRGGTEEEIKVAMKVHGNGRVS